MTLLHTTSLATLFAALHVCTSAATHTQAVSTAPGRRHAAWACAGLGHATRLLACNLIEQQVHNVAHLGGCGTLFAMSKTSGHWILNPCCLRAVYTQGLI